MSAKLLVIYGFALFHTIVMLAMAVTNYRQMREDDEAGGSGIDLMFPSASLSRPGRYHRARMWIYLGAASLSIAVILLVYVFLHGRI